MLLPVHHTPARPATDAIDFNRRLALRHPARGIISPKESGPAMVTTVAAHVKNGVIIPDTPIDLPDGAKVQVQIGSKKSKPAVKSNEEGLAMLRDVAEITRGMQPTDGSETDRLIREARSGAMYSL